ncbi:hypothetical protein ACFWAR_12260 [Streptomyces sp. NPDC059917]|uniref:hypothetical protein n=1 Tax=Streptomyces sp. NPDC059917 TaxID=3347002 RepID=UPI00365E6957
MERRRVLGIGAGLGAGAGAVWAWRAFGGREDAGGGAKWHTDSAPVEAAFPELGPLTDAEWVSSRDNERDLPSPELSISGFARLAPGRLAELTAAHAFVPEAPTGGFTSWFEKPLAGRGPQHPRWIRIPGLDRDGGGSSTRLWFDRGSDTVRFTALNPYG